MRVIRKQFEHGERRDEEEAVSNGTCSWKELSEVVDDCNIQEERLDEANDPHWEVYNSVVDESTSTDNEHCHNHENDVHERGGCTVDQNFTYLLRLKEVEIGKLQIVKEQIVTVAFTNLSPAITLLNA